MVYEPIIFKSLHTNHFTDNDTKIYLKGKGLSYINPEFTNYLKTNSFSELDSHISNKFN